VDTIDKLLNRKGAQVRTISPAATAVDAALEMNEHGIGALVVVKAGQVVGIVTERDVLRRIVAKRRDPADCPVGEIMTREVVCCRSGTPIKEARAIFMQQRIRHLPVVSERGALEGLVSIGDVNAWQLDGQEQEIHYLHEYLYGRT
jgi:CBS domain-containing protein